MGISPQPPPVCSIHLDDTATATGQRHQCAHHTPATGGEERESHRANQVYAHTSYRWRGERVIEPIKCMHTPATGGEERESYGAFPLHGTVRFGTARYGTVRLSSGRFAFPPQFSTAIEWAGLFTRRYNCAASTAVTSS